jgi:hypothetical protein
MPSSANICIQTESVNLKMAMTVKNVKWRCISRILLPRSMSSALMTICYSLWLNT